MGIAAFLGIFLLGYLFALLVDQIKDDRARRQRRAYRRPESLTHQWCTLHARTSSPLYDAASPERQEWIDRLQRNLAQTSWRNE